jgi:peptide/nickel transport system permease protein
LKVFTYILKRTLFLIPVMIGVLIIVFIVGRIIPADPVHFFIGQESDQAYVEQVRKELYLDSPIWVQFYHYAKDLLQGDLGMSWSTRNPVRVDLAARLPATFELITVSLIVCVLIAIPLGVAAAVKRDTWIDHIARLGSLFGIAIPSFWFGLLLIYFFFYKFGILPPPMGRTSIGVSIETVTGFNLIDSLIAGNMEAFYDTVSHLIMPVLALTFARMAQLTRLVRSSMIEVLSSLYIEVARSQGLKERTIYYRLALKNAILPSITQIGQMWGQLIGGAVVVELVFAWPGTGSWAVDAALAGDFAPVQAFAVICAASYVLLSLATDVLYIIIDPRIKF